MPRNLDLTALRAFATVVATGGVTKAAAVLNLTQSAVSMQIKRLEESLDMRLLERTGRGVHPTSEGEKVLAYARRLLTLNDELLHVMQQSVPEGEIRLGVPHDIVPRCVPAILRAFAAEYPRTRITLISSVTSKLRTLFAEGGCDVYLATENVPSPGGTEIVRLPLVWVGAENGTMWRQRPLRLAFARDCAFRVLAQNALNAADIPWDMAMTADSSRAVDASVSADLACHVVIDGFAVDDMRAIDHGGALPDVGEVGITVYAADTGRDPARTRLVELVQQVYGGLRPTQRKPVLAAG